VNSFTENKVLKSRVLYTLQECKWGAHHLFLGRSADVQTLRTRDTSAPVPNCL